MILLQDQQTDVVNPTGGFVKSLALKESEYLLKPDDRIGINFFSNTKEEANFMAKFEGKPLEAKLDAQGQVDLPVIGQVKLSGLTIDKAEKKLKSTFADYLKSPRVAISLLSFNYTVIGEVGNQGKFNALEPRVTVLDALGQAGGFTEFANRENIKLIRNQGGKATIYELNVLEDNLLLSDKYFLQPDDVIVVNQLKNRTTNRDRLSTVSIILSILTSLVFVSINLSNR
jgi:polysaccharide export outer membrane protein